MPADYKFKTEEKYYTQIHECRPETDKKKENEGLDQIHAMDAEVHILNIIVLLEIVNVLVVEK